MSDPAEQFPPEQAPDPAATSRGTGALRLVAVVSMVVTIAAGVAIARAWALGLGFLAFWLLFAVPGIALVILVVVEWLRRRHQARH